MEKIIKLSPSLKKAPIAFNFLKAILNLLFGLEKLFNEAKRSKKERKQQVQLKLSRNRPVENFKINPSFGYNLENLENDLPVCINLQSNTES